MKSLNFYRPTDFRTTVISISSDVGFITIRIESKLGPKQRRTVGRSIFAQLKPLLGYLRNVYLHHWDNTVFDFNRAEGRGFNTFKQSDFKSLQSKFGLKLRLFRQQKALTLNALSQKLGIAASHLSEMERGLHYPRKRNLDKILAYIKSES